MKIRSMEAELHHTNERTDGRADRPTDILDEVNSRFSKFANALNNNSH